MKKSVLWAVIAVVGVIGIFFAMNISINNGAIFAEEQVFEANSKIEAAQKRRVDLIYNLVDTVEAYADHESETFKAVAELRTGGATGTATVENAQLAFNAVAEAYPELKANETYKQLMTELTVTENDVRGMRENFNREIRNYNKFTRKFPNSFFLGLGGYEVIEYTYLDFDAPADAPQDLFNKDGN